MCVLYNTGEERYIWTARSIFEVNTEKYRFLFVCSSCQNHKYANFMLLFRRGRQEIVKCVLHVQHDYL